MKINKTYYLSGQLKTEETVINGKRHGLYKSFHENGNIHVIGNYIDNTRCGTFLVYINNNLDSKIQYVNNKKHGVNEWYIKDVSFLRYYNNDKRHGMSLVYDKDNNIIKMEYYYNNELIPIIISYIDKTPFIKYNI